MMPTIREVRDNGDGTLTVLVAVTVQVADLKKSGKKASKKDRLAAIKAAAKKAVA